MNHTYIITADNSNKSINLAKVRSDFTTSKINQFVGNASHNFIDNKNSLLGELQFHQTAFQPVGQMEGKFVQHDNKGIFQNGVLVPTIKESYTDLR